MIVNQKNVFLISMLMCASYAIPIFFGGGYYIDDLIRSINGNTDWLANGRPLAEVFMKFFFFGNKMVDISPMPQFSALVISSLTVTFLSKKYFNENLFIGLLVFIPLWISPFFLQNISYKYDAPIMSISVFFATIVFCHTSKYLLKLFFVSLVSLLASLNFYQPSANIFVIFIVIDFVFYFSNKSNDEAFKRAIIFISSYIISNILYLLLIPRFFVKGDYSVEHSQVDFSFSIFQTIENNLLSFFYMLKMSIPDSFIFSLAPVTILALISSVKVFVFCSERALIKKIMAVAFLILSWGAICFFVVGPMVLLKTPTLAPRTLIGFSGFLCALFFYSTRIETKNIFFNVVVILIPCVYMYQFSYAYYNAMINQNRYEQIVISNISKSVDEFSSYGFNNVAINGRVKLSPENRLAVDVFPILDFLIPRTLNNVEFWSSIQLMHYDINMNYPNHENIKSVSMCSFKKIRSGIYFNLYYTNKTLIFDFDKEYCQ
ncbi:glucosyltransferase domain-containing protein [Aeromonas veronii]